MQLLGASANLFFRALALLDVNNGSKPLENLSLLVAQRDFVVQHPAIFAIGAAYARFMQKWLATGERRAPLSHDRLDVFGMNRSGPFPALEILERASHVGQPSLIEEIEVAVG